MDFFANYVFSLPYQYSYLEGLTFADCVISHSVGNTVGAREGGPGGVLVARAQKQRTDLARAGNGTL